jgi:hypothetical protein
MIQGYPDNSSALPGDTITFHVSTDAPQFRIDFYRQGATLDFQLSTDWMAGVFADDHDPDQDWGIAATRRDGKQVEGWTAYLFTIPDDWSSGVYIAMFVEGDGQEKPNSNQDPPLETMTPDARSGKALIVIKNPVPGVVSQVLYKIPLFTYQMYNSTFTGFANQCGSGYQGFLVTLHRPGGGTGGTPWDVLCFSPPNYDVFDRASFRQTFVHWDAKFISWLEGQGFRIDYCTDLDIHLDNNGSLLSPYALVLSVGHDEYYSAEMRDHLESYIANGGNVAFFSGNTCYWRLSFPDEGSLLRIKGQDSQWANVGRPEDSLTGVGFRHGGERNYPIPQNDNQKVGYTVQHTNLWPFENTGLGENDTFGKDACIVGYECDGTPYDLTAPRPVNPNFDPRDRTPSSFVILGTGVTSSWDINGAATMGMYSNSGTVFTAATTDWPRVVWQGDPHTVQITQNVINRLGGNPKGLSQLSSFTSIICCDGFFSSDDQYRHAIIGTSDGSLTEIFFNPQRGQGQTLLTIQNGLVDLGAFYSNDDQYRHIITATSDGNIWEIFYNPSTGLGQTILGNFPNTTHVCGFFSTDDNYRHAIVATADGNVTEIFFNPQTGQGQTLLGNFDEIVDIAAFFSPDDNFRHVLVATADGNVTEIFFNPQTGQGQTVIANVPGLNRISSYYATDDRFFNRRVQVSSRTGTVYEVRYHPNFGIIRAVLFNTGGLIDVGSFFSPDDNFRHAVLATSEGDIQELFFGDG